MHNRDKMVDHQEQEAGKDNTDHSQQCLQEQLAKHRRIDTVEDILKQFEKQTEQNIMSTHNEQLYKVPTVNSTSDTHQANMQNNTNDNSMQRRIAVKN